MPIYLDNNATTPLEPEVRDVMFHYFDAEYGNAGSRTHEYGARANKAVQLAREQIAVLADADPSEVLFTSGATEANNLAILGMADHGRRSGRKHLVTTAIEHKAVLEPMRALEAQGFELTVVGVGESGRASPKDVLAAVRDDTLLISLMHANNETGILQPIEDVADGLQGHPAFFHVDAVQGFGKELNGPRNKRIDMLSVSAHKLFGPKGVGALIARKRGYQRPPISPIAYGGGQERGLRPGTLPVPLIAGFGTAAAIALRDHRLRKKACSAERQRALSVFGALDPIVIGDQSFVLDHVLAIGFKGVDSEALMLALRDKVSISNGSACTSARREASHVLTAMGLHPDALDAVVRFSWSHLQTGTPWAELAQEISALRINA
ncbi:aminotransferase class V-fold PLP-dependent enzyme [Aliiroseovarius marinus]|uniref:aminotransferase class V-fold PLP-dependent enzyme n=1 Tax=Aliiroseovarius marinus TaxID=2500159 RepID=UPI00105FE640|nr:aminotransferase class V-fold PLP-dependent enzyme [Aliiroseovarius marinus]